MGLSQQSTAVTRTQARDQSGRLDLERSRLNVRLFSVHKHKIVSRLLLDRPLWDLNPRSQRERN